MKLHIAFLVLAVSFSSKAQNVSWAKQSWGENVAPNRSQCVDAFGNNFQTGMYHMRLNTYEDVALKGNAFYNTFISKHDSKGNLLWAKTSGTSNIFAESTGYGIACDVHGNLYVSGYFQSDIYFDNAKPVVSKGYADIFLAKFDRDGNLKWLQSMGSPTSGDFGYTVDADRSGNVYIAGSMHYPFTIGKQTLNGINDGFNNSFVAKFNEDGDLQWVKVGKDSWTANVTLTPACNAVFYGSFEHYTKWGSDSVPTRGQYDYYVGRLAPDGSQEWLTTIGSTGFDYISDVVADNTGIYYIGYFGNDLAINGSPVGGIQQYTAYAGKINNDGRHDWITPLSADTIQYLPDRLIIDYSGQLNAFINENEGPAFNAPPGYTMLYQKINTSNGNIDYTRRYKNIHPFMNADVDRFGNIYLRNFFQNSATFENIDLYVYPTGAIGACIARLGHNTAAQPIIYPNPAQDEFGIFMNDNETFPYTCKVYDMLGREVINAELQRHQQFFDLRDMASAVYNVVITGNGQTYTIKLMKY